jgi:hypothetical protein
MSRHEVGGLPPGVVVTVGWDRALGFWVEVRRPGQPHVTYDATTPNDGITTISGVLNALIEAEVIEREDVADAEMWLAMDGDVANIPEEHVGLRVAAEVIVHLRQAAAG